MPYAIIFSSGYSEVGGKGVDMQQELTAIARQYDIGVIGPNCQGMINIADNVFAGFGSVFTPITIRARSAWCRKAAASVFR